MIRASHSHSYCCCCCCCFWRSWLLFSRMNNPFDVRCCIYAKRGRWLWTFHTRSWYFLRSIMILWTIINSRRELERKVTELFIRSITARNSYVVLLLRTFIVLLFVCPANLVPLSTCMYLFVATVVLSNVHVFILHSLCSSHQSIEAMMLLFDAEIL